MSDDRVVEIETMYRQAVIRQTMSGAEQSIAASIVPLLNSTISSFVCTTRANVAASTLMAAMSFTNTCGRARD
jgi:hypothetical protein